MQLKDTIEDVNAINRQVYTSADDYSDIETSAGIKDLMNDVSQSYEQYKVSQNFKDEALEKEYQRSVYKDMLNFQFIYTIEATCMTLTVTIYQTLKLIALGNNYPQHKWFIFLLYSTYVISIAHHLLCRKYQRLTSLFAVIQTPLIFIGSLEMTILGNTVDQLDSYAVQITIMASIALTSYNQLSLLVVDIISLVYCIVRTYFWIEVTIRYMRFNMFIIMSFFFIYFIARAFHQGYRDRFKHQHQQEKVLGLFYNLIKLYHDGILITSKDQIVLYNKEINNIFNINPETNLYQDQGPANTERMNLLNQTTTIIREEKKKLISDSLKQAQRLQSISPQTSTNNEEMNTPKTSNLQHDNIWAFINYQDKLSEKPTLNDTSINFNPHDGIYFKVQQNKPKDRDEEEDNGKQIMVFSKILKIGSNQLVLTSIRDMSSWIQLEKQKNLSVLQTIAFASAAHEFRNPLNAISSSLELLEDMIDHENGQKYFQIAKNCCNLMLFLVRDILDFSQIQSKSLILNISNVNLIATIQDCINSLQFKANEKKIGLLLLLETFDLQYISTDQNRVKQILINLLSNAIKYTIQGSVQVYGELDRINERFKIIVEDTGVGIEESQQKNLFTAFTKILDNRSLNKDGVGLGLTMSKKIAKALKGDIVFDSKVGRGSKFMLCLPLSNQRQSATQRPTNQNQEEEFKYYDRSEQNCTSLDGDFCIYTMPQDYFNGGPQKEINQLNFNTQVINRQRNSQFIKQTNDFLSSQDLKINKYKAFNYRTVSRKQTQSHQICSCSQVLIVDDESFNLVTLEGMIQSIKMIAVDSAYNGKEALSLVQINNHKDCINHVPYKIIFLDNHMPLMDGIKCGQQLREWQRQGLINQGMSIILITGDEQLLNNQESSSLFNQILIKPISKSRLQQVLRQAFE